MQLVWGTISRWSSGAKPTGCSAAQRGLTDTLKGAEPTTVLETGENISRLPGEDMYRYYSRAKPMAVPEMRTNVLALPRGDIYRCSSGTESSAVVGTRMHASKPLGSCTSGCCNG